MSVNGIYKDVHYTVQKEYKSNIFLLHVKRHFYFDRLPWSFCVYTVWYDAGFLKWNRKILMKWLTACKFMCSCRHVVRCRGQKSPRVHIWFSICVVNKTASPTFIYTRACERSWAVRISAPCSRGCSLPPLSHTRPLRSIPLPAHLQFHPAPVKSLHARSNLKFLCMPNTCRFQLKPYPRFTLHASAARYGSEEVLFLPPHGANLHQKRFISEVAGFARPRDLPVRRCFSWFYFFIF